MRPFALLLALSLVPLAACSGSRGERGPAEIPAGAAAARLYAAKCSACHRPYEPASRTREEWSAALDRMAGRAHLREDERATILGYLQGKSRDAGAPR